MKEFYLYIGCFVCLIGLLLYVNVIQLRICWDGPLLNHTVPGQASRRQFISIKCPLFHQYMTTGSSSISTRDFFPRNTVPDARVEFGTAAYEADTLPTKLPCPVILELFGENVDKHRV